jgi:hypothetical protein
MKKLLLFLLTSTFTLNAFTQDSLYYSVQWKPTFTYQKAGVQQEEIFGYRYKDGILQDSLLLNRNLYDSLGQLIRMDVYYSSILIARHQYFYSGNRLDSMTQEEIWTKPKFIHRYSYDANGNLSLKETFYKSTKTLQERYVYNSNNQLLQTFQKMDRGPEILINEYKYRNDRLIQQIDYLFEGRGSRDNFSYLYIYTNRTRTTTKFFQRSGKEKRLIDCIQTYNEKGQLLEKVNPPLLVKEWLPPGTHPRLDESVETYSYHQNGLLAEVRAKVSDRLVWVRKHFYFY